MANAYTKVVSVRIPLDLYFEILEKARENKMTISDYALRLMFYAKDKPQDIGNVSSINEQEYIVTEADKAGTVSQIE